MNAIATVAPHAPQLAYAEMERLAADMANSGLFGFKTKQEAMSIMMIAQAEGKHPATAARDYDVINKKLAKRAEAMMRDFMEGGGRVKWNALTDEVADATFSHPQGGEVRISWDMARALQAGLSTKENWRKYPRQMLRNRTVSEGVRTVWPLATSGMYERGEVEDFTGKTIDGTAEMPTERPSDARQALNDSIPLKTAAATMPRGESVAGSTVYDPADDHHDPADVCLKCQGTGRYMNTDKPCFACNGTGNTAKKPIVTGKDTAPAPERTREAWVMWINGLIQACDKQTSREGIEAIAARPSVEKALAEAPPWAKDEIDAIIGDFMAKLPAAEPGDDLDEVEIVGQDKLAAG